MKKFLVPFAGLALLVACGGEAPEAEVEAPAEQTASTPATPAGPPLLALHLYNPVSDEGQGQLLSMLRDLNQGIAATGLAETRYSAWTVTGEQAGDYSHLFGSVWPDRANYDAVHEHEAYTAVAEQIEETGLDAAIEEVYNRYELLNPPAEPPPPMPGGSGTLAAVHLFDLPSATEEAQVLDMLTEFNDAVANAGHPESRYGIWKVTGEQVGERGHMMVSVWADRAAYDEVHAHAGYTAVMEKHQAAFEALVGEEIYNQYESVPLE